MKQFKYLVVVLAALLLTACNTYKVEVDLTKEELATLKTSIGELKVDISEYDQANGFHYIAIIDLARAYVKTGELGKAINLYENVVSEGAKNSAIYHNLGRLYEKTEQYDLAVEIYQKIIDEFFQEKYLYDITWAYIRAEDRKSAEKYFNAWQLALQKTDEQTQQAIKKLREKQGLTR